MATYVFSVSISYIEERFRYPHREMPSRLLTLNEGILPAIILQKMQLSSFAKSDMARLERYLIEEPIRLTSSPDSLITAITRELDVCRFLGKEAHRS